jgi:hypothetical protein
MLKAPAAGWFYWTLARTQWTRSNIGATMLAFHGIRRKTMKFTRTVLAASLVGLLAACSHSEQSAETPAPAASAPAEAPAPAATAAPAAASTAAPAPASTAAPAPASTATPAPAGTAKTGG